MDDLISRQDAIDMFQNLAYEDWNQGIITTWANAFSESAEMIRDLPSAQPTLCGYNIGHLELIARVLQKEDLPPERIVEVVKDIGRIVAIVKDEFEESLKKAVEQCTI